jgi:hypothetical protein
MRSSRMQFFRTSALASALGGALLVGSAIAQSAGPPAPAPTQPSAGTAAPPSPASAGTAGVGTAPPNPASATSTGVGTAAPPPPLGANPTATTPANGLGIGNPGTGVVPSKSTLTAPAFDMLDAGRRGFVTREDTAKLPGFDTAFQQADENNDGRLSESEFTRAWMNYSRQP